MIYYGNEQVIPLKDVILGKERGSVKGHTGQRNWHFNGPWREMVTDVMKNVLIVDRSKWRDL